METTKYFLIEWQTVEGKDKFFADLKNHASKVEYFATKIGQFVLEVSAIFDPNCELENHIDPTDVIYNHRPEIKKIKEYYRNPAPQKHWTGEWVVIK